MYGIFTYIWLIFMVNVGKYTIHGAYGLWGNQHSYLEGMTQTTEDPDQPQRFQATPPTFGKVESSGR